MVNARDYQERIFSKWLAVILAIATGILLGTFLYQHIIGPLSSRPVPDLFLLILTFFLLFITINFAVLTIRITSFGISVGYGVLRHHIDWNNVNKCYQDNVSSIRYGGFGVRLGIVNGRRRLVYNTLGDPRVVVRIRQGKFQEFVFSTRNPEDVIQVITDRIRHRE